MTFAKLLGADRPPPDRPEVAQGDMFTCQVIGLHECLELVDLRRYEARVRELKLAEQYRGRRA